MDQVEYQRAPERFPSGALTRRAGARRRAVSALLGVALAAGTSAMLVTPAGAATEDLPVRVLDTRTGVGAEAGRVSAGQTVAFEIGHLTDAPAAILNVTVIEPSAPGYARVWPCALAHPATSNVNFTWTTAVANAAVTANTPGGVCIATSVDAHIAVDLVGELASSTGFTATPPQRALDTRLTATPLRSGVERRVPLPELDARATFAALNLVAVEPTAPGWIVAYPCGTSTGSSTLNFEPGDIVAAFTLAGISSDGEVCVRSSVDVHLVVDVFGWSTGAGDLQVQPPARLYDSRVSGGGIPSDQYVALPTAGWAGVTDAAEGVVVTLTATNSSGYGHATVWPCDQPRPVASAVNVTPGTVARANLVATELAADGTICVYSYTQNGTPLDYVVDVVGAWGSADAIGPDTGQPGPVTPTPPPGGSSAMPSAATVGPRCAPTQTMSSEEALAHLRAHRYLSCVTIDGGLSLTGSDGVGWVIEDVRIQGGNYVVRAYAGGGGDFTGAPDQRPVLRHVDLVGSGAYSSQSCSSVVYGRDMIIEYADIYGCTDGIKASDGFVVRHSWVHDLDHPEGAHSDAVQIRSGVGIELHGNRFDGYWGYSSDGSGGTGGTVNGVLQTGSVTGPIQATWTNNWFAGGHYTIRGSSDPLVEYVFRNNRWLATGTSVALGVTDLPPSKYGPLYSSLDQEDFDDSNVWDATGLPVLG